MNHNIDEVLKQIIVSISERNLSETEITDHTILTKDFGFDSLRIIGMIVAIEKYFNVEFSDDDLFVEKLSDFKTLSAIVEKLLQEKSGVDG